MLGTKSTFHSTSVSQSVEVCPSPQFHKNVTEAEFDPFVLHRLMPLFVAVTYTKVTLKTTSFKYCSALPAFHRHKRGLFILFIFFFKKQHFLKGLSKSWDFVKLSETNAIAKLSCSFVMTTYQTSQVIQLHPCQTKGLIQSLLRLVGGLWVDYS